MINDTPPYRICRHWPLQEGCTVCRGVTTNPKLQHLAGPLPEGIEAITTIALPVARNMVQRTRCKFLGAKIKGKSCGDANYRCDFDGVTCNTIKECPEAERCCQKCDYFLLAPATRFAPSGTRHLLYHCWPVRGNGMWQRNLAEVEKRLHLFNGKRLVGLAHNGTNIDDYDAARTEFLRLGFQVMEAKNVPAKRECQTWPLLWQALAITNPHANDSVFYGHAKGVARGTATWSWSQIMYDSLLDYWPVVADTLKRFPIAGSFKKNCKDFAGTTFHYSGGMYWVRYGSAVGKIGKLDNKWYGTESWPGTNFAANEAGVIFHEGKRFDLYNHQYFNNKVLPEWTLWKQQQKTKLALAPA